MELNSVLLGPVLTEKCNVDRELSHYTFKVDFRANKIMVMEAVAKSFNVHPLACNISIVKAKPKRLRNRPGKTARWKKAIVTLQKGEHIAIFEGA